MTWKYGSVDPAPTGLLQQSGGVHPVSSTDNTLARFDSTLGALQGTGIVCDDSDNVSAIGTLAHDGVLTSQVAGVDVLVTTGGASPTITVGTANAAYTGQATVALKTNSRSASWYLPQSGGVVVLTSSSDANGFSFGTTPLLALKTALADFVPAVRSDVGYQALATAVTATGDGLTTGLIPTNTSVVAAAAGGSADNVITLPAPVVGMKIRVYTDATGCEMRTVAASGQTINNVDSDGTNELALVASCSFTVECVAANTWIARGFDNVGADIAALVPDGA